MRRLSLALLLMFAVAAPSAQAQSCASFTDITVFSPFCTNVQWLKNRAVTLGCTPTTYCPNDPVNRLQMAAFMNRVGNVLTPRVLSVEESGGALDLMSFNFVCQTPDLPDAGYSRDVHADGALSYMANGPGLLQLSVFMSNDGGATWSPAPLNDAVVTVGMTGVGREHAGVTLERKQLLVNTGVTTRFGIRVVRGTNLTTSALTAWNCQLQAVVSTHAE